jgi:hypothetical protein
MAKHRSHIVRPVLADNNSKLTSKIDFVFSEDIKDWMFPKSTDGRKRRDKYERERA